MINIKSFNLCFVSKQSILIQLCLLLNKYAIIYLPNIHTGGQIKHFEAQFSLSLSALYFLVLCNGTNRPFYIGQ